MLRNDRVVRHVEEAPWYRGLIAARPEVKTRIPVNATSDVIELSLYKETLHWRGEVFQRGARLLEELKSEGKDFDSVREKLWEHHASLKTSELDDLARYVYHRKAVLHWLETYLSYTKEQGAHNVREEVIHDLFLRSDAKSSRDGYFSHNLWVIDDNLTFHQFASSHRPRQGDGSSELELVASSRGIFTERDDNDAECRSVVIVEFKKSGLHPYGTDNDPMQCIRNAAELIATRSHQYEHGKTLLVGPGTRYSAYIIAEDSPDASKFAKHYSMKTLPNGAGWYRHFSDDDPRIYVEMLTYSHALEMAKRRNAAFFHLLGIRAPSSPSKKNA